MALKPLKYIEINDEKGQVFSAGKQSLILPIDFLSSLNNIFGELFSDISAQIIIYKIGQAIGESYASSLENILKEQKIELSKETMLKESYNAIFMEAGWGRIEMVNFDLEKDDIKIKIHHPTLLVTGESHRHSIEGGILSGSFKKIIGRDIYFNFLEENTKDNTVIFISLQTMPKEYLIQEKMALTSRQDLENKIQERTKELENLKNNLTIIVDNKTGQLQDKIQEMEKFQELTIGRELKMIELKKEIAALRGEPRSTETERERLKAEKNNA